MREIHVDTRPYEEIKIGNTVFKLDISDAALNRYVSEFAELVSGLKNNPSYEEVKKAIQTIVNTIFYDEPFDTISAECGNKLLEMTKAMNEVAGILRDLLAVK
jgi:alcohol dehydrogenase YqhD (iron-dependent ADH family)